MPDDLEAKADKFTFRVATDRLYTEAGLWVLPLQTEGRGLVRVGLSDYLQQRSGDMAFATVKPAGTLLAAGDDFAEVETVKANVSLPSPVSGTVIEVNASLLRHPDVVNQDPYGKGWLATLAPSAWEADRASLLNPDGYFSIMRSQVHQELQGS
jgi:glycine cleavage system H protein